MSKSETVDMQNRELSWLRFNGRIFDEAADEANPLLERLNFLSIFTSNLDEFFMVRVGSLHSLSCLKHGGTDGKTGMSPAQQLHAIHSAVRALVRRRDRVFATLERELDSHGISRLEPGQLTPSERRHVERRLRREILPFLSPQVVDARHPFPLLENKALCVAVSLKSREKHPSLGLIVLPSSLPRLLLLPGLQNRYLLLEQAVLSFADGLFPGYTVLGRAVVSVTRSADLDPDDELFEDAEDYRRQMRRMLKRRARLAAVRLEIQQYEGSALRDSLMKRIPLGKEQVYRCQSPLTMDYVRPLADALPAILRRRLSYPPFEPQNTVASGSMLRLLSRRDVLLSYPYESMEPFLRLIKEAANDPAVLSIKITIYRLASKSRLVEYLSAAAENGKEVLVLLELRARFDEANNIDWAEHLEDAGCRVIYGLEEYKVHSKLCLITRRSRGGVSYFTQIGTGNYNEKTARLYTDLSLMTSDREIGLDAAAFFRNLAVSNLQGEYRCLLAAPHSLKRRLLSLIAEQASRARKGEPARILAKVNSLTDMDIIAALRSASQAGVRVDLIVRGICCILPGVPGSTENIRVLSVVGRFLEHSRVFCFLGGDREEVYLSSADWMTRNLSRRVELACPVRDARIRRRLITMLEAMLADNTKARLLRPDGSYAYPARREGEALRSCQAAFLRRARRDAAIQRRVPFHL